MVKVGITGVGGFIGWHLKIALEALGEVSVYGCDRDCFSNDVELANFVKESDVIVHLAGMNRGEEEEVYKVNVALTQRLIEFCEKKKQKPQIIFSSSTHSLRDSAYGRSKKECSRLFAAWAEDEEKIFTDLIVPNVYGEFQREEYNSAVATFSSQIVKNLSSQINQDAKVELVHVSEVTKEIVRAIQDKTRGEIRIMGSIMTVGELYLQLKSMWENYSKNILPPLTDARSVTLFNTLRSYVSHETFYPRPYEQKIDDRGRLFEIMKALSGGQVFISWTKPGVTRGNHYHIRKFERFAVVQGEAKVSLRKVGTESSIEYNVSGEFPTFIDMPTFYVHNITNVGSVPLITLFWTNEFFDPADTDTYQSKST